MIEWLPMDQAPKDGTVVLLVAMQYYSYNIAQHYRDNPDLKPRALWVMAKYSTWEQVWKRFPDGQMVAYPDYFEPHAFARVEDVPTKDHYADRHLL